MVTRIAVVAALIAAGMGAVKDGRLLKVAGLTGSCAVVQTAPGGEQIEACSSGRLEGAPDLSRSGCTDDGLYAGRVYWRCPTVVASAPMP
jgi:hypothetical protein